MLGQILLLMEEDTGWATDETKKRLKGLQFRTQGGGWADVSHLLTGGRDSADEEELLRHDLAPLSRRLHQDYYLGLHEAKVAPGLEFFILCRERMQASVEDLSKWILEAEGDVKHAALVYLVKGEQRNKVSDMVRGQGWLAAVLNDEAMLGILDVGQRRELKRLLATDEQIDKGLGHDPDEDSSPPSPTIGIGEALKRIEAWWKREGRLWADDYRRRIYPNQGIKLAIDPDTGRFDRSSWLILFALGSFQGMGRTQEEQHRGFIEHCQRLGWWKTFAESDPKQNPEEWMTIIEKYAESQHEDEEWAQWIAQFPKLYRLSRWMKDYVELFLSIDRFNEPFCLDGLLTPKANSHFQGGGIDVPPLNRTLKVGAHLVVRELLHHGVISNPLAIPHAYAPIERVRRLFERFDEPVENSQDLYGLLKQHLEGGDATFGGAFDIPLRIVAADEGRQQQLFDLDV